ncbi:hypothetical protein [Alicyclobacillus dauci]|uniref:DUF3052 domain-containing protein n=1 Tax=Alicyclobacillus dauci TaxID=1475485 RepID=A0ABY6Z688_9BACL|nr:hypothetical protein [Alicyclobacillus dauci]WAH38028.1 hypothetical protein NZD86_05945 [Alicyclobacillus dauci]
MPLVKKLLIKPGYRMTIVNAPKDFIFPTEELPDDIEIVNDLEGSFDFVLIFAHSQAELGTYAVPVVSHLKEDALFWVAYPKKTSKIKSDISRDHGWELLQDAGYQGVSLISLDDTWSAFRLRKRDR